MTTGGLALGAWSGVATDASALMREYDWDGAIAPMVTDICALVGESDWRDVAVAFWTHYLARPEMAAMRPMMTGDRLARRVALSTEYTRAIYERPFEDTWRRMATQHAADAHAGGIPLPALLSALARAHSFALERLESRVAGDSARMARFADVVQRIALAEAQVMTAHLARMDAAAATAERSARGAEFRERIAGAIDGAAALGDEIRTQASGASAAARSVLSQASEVATASEQSAAAMRDAATTAAGLIRAIDEVRRDVDEAARVAADAAQQSDTALGVSETLSDHAKSIESILQLIRDIAGQTNLLALNATIEAARAGDSGRGFAVVAQEVKNLAHQTARATDDIAAKIAAIQAATGRSLKANAAIRAIVGEVEVAAGRIRSATGAQATTVTAITAAIDETAMTAHSMSGTIAGVLREAGEVAGNFARLDQGFATVGDELSALKAAAEEYSRSVA